MTRSDMKIMGVLGGIGPQATMDFETRVHRIAQTLIPQWTNSGYPPMIVYYYRHAPVLMADDETPLFPIQLDPCWLEIAKQIGTLADFLVITANGPHTWQEQIEQAAGCEILSMVDVTLREVQKRGWQKVGVLGLGNPVVYTEPLSELGIAYETLNAELQPKLDGAIFALMAGQKDAESRAVTGKAVQILRERNVDGIILGCTELPFLLTENAEAPDLINPAQLLAEAAVRYALS